MRRRKQIRHQMLTARQLVDAVEAVPEDERRELLAELGYDAIAYVRARVALKLPNAGGNGYVWDDTTTRVKGSPQ